MKDKLTNMYHKHGVQKHCVTCRTHGVQKHHGVIVVAVWVRDQLCCRGLFVESSLLFFQRLCAERVLVGSSAAHVGIRVRVRIRFGVRDGNCRV